MVVNNCGFQVDSPIPGPGEVDLAELVRLRARFYRHHIFCDATRARGIRYIAHGVTIDVRPHTVITRDLAELRDELERSAPEELGSVRQSSTRVQCTREFTAQELAVAQAIVPN